MTRIFIIRHAEAEGNLYRRLHGQYDSLLTENGLKQVAALRKRFEKEQVDACYSSDLIRTRMTAKAIYEPKHLPLQTDPRFREIRMGIWEEVPFGEVGQHEKHLLDTFNEDPAHWVIPGAERYEEYTGRFLAAMTEAQRRTMDRVLRSSPMALSSGAFSCACSMVWTIRNKQDTVTTPASHCWNMRQDNTI